VINLLEKVIKNVCPNCVALGAFEEGKVFRSLIKMNEQCPVCKYRFEKEQGYFLGAMSLSYVLGFLLILPLFLYLLFQDLPFAVVIALPSLELLLVAPFTLRLSRLAWIHFDFKVTPK
jgi:uncharacterized protein (DUF983 family)